MPSAENVASFFRLLSDKRLIIMGVGNEMRRDDGVGVYLARRLAEARRRDGVSILVCGQAPENFVREVSRASPDIVLIIDAIHSSLPPGSVVLCELKDGARPICLSTHKVPLELLARYVRLICKPSPAVFLLGIQVKDVGFGEGLSDEVARSADLLASLIIRELE